MAAKPEVDGLFHQPSNSMTEKHYWMRICEKQVLEAFLIIYMIQLNRKTSLIASRHRYT